tara:strand:+ start:128 stop:580 length:453 start_codon:yes stop_codon:yes gene_type:complete
MPNQEKNKVYNKVFDMVKSSSQKIDLVYAGYAEKANKMREGMERPNLDKYGKRIGQSTHKMQTEIGEKLLELGVKGVEPGKWYSFPTLFPDKKKPNRWIDYGGGQDERLNGKGADLRGAYEEALSRGETFEFGKDEESAIKFGLGSWKIK